MWQSSADNRKTTSIMRTWRTGTVLNNSKVYCTIIKFLFRPFASFQLGSKGRSNLVDPANFRYRKHTDLHGGNWTRWRCIKAKDPVKRLLIFLITLFFYKKQVYMKPEPQIEPKNKKILGNFEGLNYWKSCKNYLFLIYIYGCSKLKCIS